MENKKIYLAIPYTGFEEHSFNLSNEIAAELIQQGYLVYSPISMSHPIAKTGKMKGGWEFWKKLDFEFILWCDEVMIIDFDDEAVENSIGVQDELKFARENGKIISHYYDSNLDIQS